jgi:hypothetical protein
MQAAGADDVGLELQPQLTVARREFVGGAFEQIDGLTHMPAMDERRGEVPHDLGALPRLRAQAERLLEVVGARGHVNRGLGRPELAENPHAGAIGRRFGQRPGEVSDGGLRGARTERGGSGGAQDADHRRIAAGGEREQVHGDLIGGGFRLVK